MQLTKLLVILSVLNFSLNIFTMDEYENKEYYEFKDNEEQRIIQQDQSLAIWNQEEVDNAKWIIDSEHPDNQLDSIRPEINACLYGDELQVSEEFLAAVGLKINIPNICQILKTSDEKYLIVRNNIYAHIIDLNLGQVVHVIKHKDTINLMQLSKNNKYILTCSNDGNAKVYFFYNKIEKTIKHNNAVTYGQITKDSKLILTFASFIAKVSIINKNKILTTSIPNEYPIREAITTTDNRYLIILTINGKLYKYDLRTFEKIEINNNFNVDIQDIDVVPQRIILKLTQDNRYLIICIDIARQTNEFRIFDLIENKFVQFNLPHLNIYQGYEIQSIKNNFLFLKIRNHFPDDEIIVNNNYKVYDIKRNIFVDDYAEPEGIAPIFLQKTNRYITLSHDKCSLNIKNLDTGEIDNVARSEQIIERFNISPNEKYLIIISNNAVNGFKIYDLELNVLNYAYNIDGSICKWIKFSKDSKYALINLTTAFIIFDLEQKIIFCIDLNEEIENILINIVDFNEKYCVIGKINSEIFLFDFSNPNNGFMLIKSNLEHVVPEQLKIFNDILMAIYESYTIIYDLNKREKINILEKLVPEENDEENLFNRNQSKFLSINNEALIGKDGNTIKIHKFNKEFLQNLTGSQIELITNLHTQNAKNKVKTENNEPIEPLRLSKEKLETFNTLPIFVKNALLCNYPNLEFSIK